MAIPSLKRKNLRQPIPISDLDATSTANRLVLTTDGVLMTLGQLVAAQVTPGTLTNAEINAAAAIVYSKLSLTGGIVNADVNAAAAIAYSKLNLATSIVNADVAAAAAIAPTKLAGGNQGDTLVSTSGTAVGAWSPRDQNPHSIVNANMAIWNEQTTYAGCPDGQMIAEGFTYIKAGAVVHNIVRSTTLPTIGLTAPYSSYSIQENVVTADASIAAGDYCALVHRMEGYLWQNYAQRQFTISFWVRDTVTGTHCVYFKNSGNDRTYVAEYTISVTNTWEFKTVTVSASPSAGTWDYTTGRGIEIGWTLSCGSTFQTTAAAWQTGDFKGTSNQVNSTATIGNDFYLWGPRITLGAQAGLFVHPSPTYNFLQTSRYFQKSNDLSVSPGTVGGNGALVWFPNATVNASTAGDLTNIPMLYYPVEMRAAPTILLYSPATGAANSIWDVTTNTRGGATGLGGTNKQPFQYIHLDNTVAVAVNSGNQCEVHWSAASRVP